MITADQKEQLRALEAMIDRAIDSRDLPTLIHQMLPALALAPENRLLTFSHALMARSAMRGMNVLAQTAGMYRDIAEQHGLIERVESVIYTVACDISRNLMTVATTRISELCAALSVPMPYTFRDAEGNPHDPAAAREADDEEELLAEEPEWARRVSGSMH